MAPKLSKRQQVVRTKVAKEVPDISAGQLEKVRSLFPGSVSEGKVDFDKLRESLGEYVEGRPERYSFTWAGKRNSIQVLQMPTRATVIPVKSSSVNFDSSENLFIEGDNLETQKLLQKINSPTV
jgi:adenine-specific DNA-methyltransferase